MPDLFWHLVREALQGWDASCQYPLNVYQVVVVKFLVISKGRNEVLVLNI